MYIDLLLYKHAIVGFYPLNNIQGDPTKDGKHEYRNESGSIVKPKADLVMLKKAFWN
jgi:hypothetical protein